MFINETLKPFIWMQKTEEVNDLKEKTDIMCSFYQSLFLELKYFIFLKTIHSDMWEKLFS